MDNIITELDEVLKGLKSALFDNKSKEQDNTLETINNIKHDSFNVKYNTSVDNEGAPNNNGGQQKASKQNGDYIINEINNTRSGISKNHQFWPYFVLILLILASGVLFGLYSYKYRAYQEQTETITNVDVVCKISQI